MVYLIFLCIVNFKFFIYLKCNLTELKILVKIFLIQLILICLIKKYININNL